MNNWNFELVVFDLDSTLVDGEGIVTLARTAGAEDEVARVTEEAMRGDMEFGESLRRRVAHLEGLSADEAEDALRSMPLTEGVVDVCRRITTDTAVFSGGFYPAAERVAELIGAEHVRERDRGRRRLQRCPDVRGSGVRGRLRPEARSARRRRHHRRR